MSVFHSRLFRTIFRLVFTGFILVGTAPAEWRLLTIKSLLRLRMLRSRLYLKLSTESITLSLRTIELRSPVFFAPDLVVNNPQNGISIPGATARRDAAGLISYSSYVRSIEYAGKLGDMVVLMGDETVGPKGSAPMAGKKVRRRFTDIWKIVSGRWVLAARQATIIGP
jgi:hypothetical protein